VDWSQQFVQSEVGKEGRGRLGKGSSEADGEGWATSKELFLELKAIAHWQPSRPEGMLRAMQYFALPLGLHTER